MKPTRDILARLERGGHILLDGGTGSELQRRGVNVSKGVSADGALGAWSATAMEDAPDVVRAIHEDYLRVGADVITANSYNANRGQLGRVGLADRMEEFSRLAVEIARGARDRLAPDGFVAGAIAPTTRFPGGWDPKRVAPTAELLREWSDQVAVLAEAGADLILIESMSAVFQLMPAVEAAMTSGLRVFLGIHAKSAGTMSSGETMEQLVAALKTEGRHVDAILLMCSAPEAISATLPTLRAAFAGPIGAYANVGYHRGSQPPRYPESQYHVIDIGENTPSRYAEYGRQWRDMGAQVLGGCCGTNPEHIAALRPVVKGP
ncbi:MAG: homocysteine S-methyltransferase family protein [Candidatus Rokuibacteriota bacterium]